MFVVVVGGCWCLLAFVVVLFCELKKETNQTLKTKKVVRVCRPIHIISSDFRINLSIKYMYMYVACLFFNFIYV